MRSSTGSAWWQLLRAGNVFTAVSNILAGFLLARGEWQPILPLVFLILSSSCLYLAGMVLNDVFDIEIDRVERPERPLPSRRIDLNMAKIVGYGLLVEGLSAAGVTVWLISSWLPLLIAVSLACAIIAYDAGMKNTTLGPLTMGLCRSLNILLGASATGLVILPKGALLYAAAIGLYTCALTLLARNEVYATQKLELGLVDMLTWIAFGCLLSVPTGGRVISLLPWLCACVCCLLIIRWQTLQAKKNPTPQTVQKSVSRLITMFIPLDALAAAVAAGWPAALIVLSLLIPTYIATRRVPMT